MRRRGVDMRRKKPLTSIPEDFAISDNVREWAGRNNYRNLEKHLEYFIDYCLANDKQYSDFDAAFRNAIRNDWARLANKRPSLEEQISDRRWAEPYFMKEAPQYLPKVKPHYEH